jgi:hypothetical protein
MSRHLLVAFTNPAEGQVTECTSWYRDVHLDEALATPGFETGQLLTRSDEQFPAEATPASEHHFLAIYTISSTPADLVRTTGRYLADGYRPPPFLARGGGGPWIFTPVGERIGSATPGEHLLLAFANAEEGRDDAFNAWYDIHVADVTALKGIESAQRLRLDDVQMPINVAKPSRSRYLTVYELSATPAQARDRIVAQRFRPSEAVDPAGTRIWSYTSIATRGSLAVAA